VRGLASSERQAFVVSRGIVVALPKKAVESINRRFHHCLHLLIGDMRDVGLAAADRAWSSSVQVLYGAVAKGQNNKRFCFVSEVGIECHLHGQPPVRSYHTATAAIELQIFSKGRCDFLERLRVFDQSFGSTGSALICPVLALKKAP